MAQLGDGVGSGFPGVIDTSTAESDDPGGTVISAAKINDATAAIIAIQTELGTDPAGLSSNVVTRFDNLPFVVGTVMLFFQAAAPTGWTQVTTQNNKALRVVSGAGGGTAGTVNFTTAFASRSVAGTNTGTAISVAQMPAHAHTVSAAITDGSANRVAQTSAAETSTPSTSSVGGGGTHTHTFTGTAIDLAVQYIDMILASQD